MDRAILGRMAALLAIGGVCLFAQGTQTASVTGTVVDPEDVPVSGARVSLTSPALQGARILSTDAKGRFAARLLPPGDYLLEIVKEGFQTILLNQRLGLDQNFQPRLRMTGTAVAVVSAAPPAVDKTDVKTASNYRMDRIDLLPMDRDTKSIALLTPSVVKGVGGELQVRGAMTSSNRFLVDGQNVEDSAYGTLGVSLVEDAIEETEVLTGAISAEYGDVDGGVINAITRSGSNTFSGQIRWNFANPAWNAATPMIDRNSVENRTGVDTTFSLGGYLIKDRLWFFTSCFKEEARELRTISADATGEDAGAGYTYAKDELRRQLKLTWLVDEAHTLVASYMNSGTDQNKRDYGAGSLATLVPQQNADELLSLDWRALWSPQVLSDIRYGFKKESFQTGTAWDSTDLAQSPIYLNGFYYNHGPFNSGDGGDHRDNQTFAAKTSVFLDAQGSHQLDLGLDWCRSRRRAQNQISGTGYVIGVSDLDPVNQTATPSSVWVYETRAGEATVESHAVYVNDKWSLNDRVALQLGLRWESYLAQDESGARLAGAGTFSPRLGLKYDIGGDARWIVGASYARYSGKILDQVLMGATHQGNAQEVDFAAKDPYTSVPYSELFNLDNYDFSASGLTYASIPGVNIRLDPALKPPAVDEYQASLAYAFTGTPLGDGYLKATAVYKNWTNLIDYSLGNNGQAAYVIPQSGETAYPYVQYWYNNPKATRNYRALELEFSTTKEHWQFQGNFTWSRLWGNYEGEDDVEPGRGEGIGAWNLDPNQVAPKGYLRGHVPFRIRLMGTYTLDSSLGKTTLGFLYRYDSGSYRSATRMVLGSALSPDLPLEAQNEVFTQYLDGQRGTLVGGSSSYVDVSVNHEWELRKVKGVPVRAFLRAVIKNVFNHQQLLIAPMVYASYPDVSTDSWTPDDPATFGQPNGASFGEPRSYGLSAGIRF